MTRALTALLAYIRSEPLLTTAWINSSEALVYAIVHGTVSEPLIQTFVGNAVALILRQQVSPAAVTTPTPLADTPARRHR